MPQIIPKKSTVVAKQPTTSDLALGEIAINHADAKLFARHPVSGVVQEIGGGGSVTNYLASKTLARFTPRENQPPATAFATLDTRNSLAVLDFDAATDEAAIFSGVIPDYADLSSGLKIRLAWMATSATSGNVRWGVQLERCTTDLDADSFDTATLVTSAANGTSGIVTVAEITATNIDSLAVGDTFRIRIYRDADDATNDTMTGDAELIAVEVQQLA